MRVLIELNGDSEVMLLAGATHGTYVFTDKRGCRLEEIPIYRDNPERIQKDWLAYGENHRDEEGHATRELTHSGWFIEIESLNELLYLLRRCGGAVAVESSPEDLLKLVSQ